MENEFYTALLAGVAEVQKRAGALMLDAHGDLCARSKSSRRDVVTKYDGLVQSMLVSRLSELDPGAGFFCEEADLRSRPDSGRVFIIDPIDGTMNFLLGLRHSCISVAYAQDGEVTAGSVYNPYSDELLCAVKGCGTTRNGSPCAVCGEPLSNTVVHFGTTPYEPALAEKSFALARLAYELSLDVRRRGSAALDLCDVAAGRAGLYFELSLSLWDYAAGALLVREAGGRCVTLGGDALPLHGEKSSIVAGSAAGVETFLSALRRRRE